MLQAVVGALREGRTANMADRGKVEAELESAMAGSNYEGLGWNVFDASDQLDPRVRGASRMRSRVSYAAADLPPAMS